MTKILSALCVLCVLLLCVVGGAEGYIDGWRVTNTSSTPAYFAPGLEFELVFQGNGSDVFVNLGPMNGSVVNVSVCQSSTCEKGPVYSNYTLTTFNTSESFALLGAVPDVGYDTVYVVVNSGRVGYKPGPQSTLNITVDVTSSGRTFHFSEIGYNCKWQLVNSTTIYEEASVTYTNNSLQLRCKVPHFNQDLYTEGTAFVMSVIQSNYEGPRILPSLSGEVVLYTGPYVRNFEYSGCFGSNATFYGQFDPQNRYACHFAPLPPGNYVAPEDNHKLICELPEVNDTTKITSISIFEKTPQGEHQVWSADTNIDSLHKCNDEDDSVPSFVWVIVAAAVIVVIVVVIVGAVLVALYVKWKRQHSGYMKVN